MLNIAFFLGELQLDTQCKVLSGIYEAAKKDGNNIFVYALTLTLEQKFNEGEYAAVMNDDLSVYDGFIIYAESIYSEHVRNALIKKVQALGKPCASIDWVIPGMINVSSNNEDAMRELSRHLIDVHNVKKVNFISGPVDSFDSITRRTVFFEEMEASGNPMPEERVFIGDYYARSGRKAVDYFESKGLLEADAYVCANDQMALGAFYALSERGINVPDDVLMTGYDDIFGAANHYPRITSVKRYEEKIGKVAYENVVNRILGKRYNARPEVKSDVEYCESCGCEKGRPISHRVVVNQYAAKNLRETRYAEMISDFSAEVTSARDYNALSEKLEKYIPGLGGDSFIACLYEKENEPSKIKMSVNYDEGDFSVHSTCKVNNILETVNVEGGGHLFVICSIHFADKCYGYTVIRNSTMPMETEFYRIFAINLGSAIEHIFSYGKMQEMIKTLDEMWVFDPMTHVYNRAGFFKFADELVKEARYNRENLFLIFLDVDGLKQVNDVYGHEMGDQLICEMADVLRKVRAKEELLMRYGGDEFVVLGEGFEEERVKAYVERIRKAMEEKNSTPGRKYRIDASIGYHMLPFDDNRPLSALIELADQKMYQEKREKHRLRDAE